MSVFDESLRKVSRGLMRFSAGAGVVFCTTALLLNADTLTLRNGDYSAGNLSRRDFPPGSNGSERRYSHLRYWAGPVGDFLRIGFSGASTSSATPAAFFLSIFFPRPEPS